MSVQLTAEMKLPTFLTMEIVLILQHLVKDIYSTVSGGKYRAENGTSMASPVVAGVAALILSKNPLMTAEQVETVLQKSAVDLGESGWDYLYGYGRVDAYKALQKTPAAISNVTLSTGTFTKTGSTKIAIAFSAIERFKSISIYSKFEGHNR